MAKSQKTILIIEDNDDNRTLERDICLLNGYNVIEAINGEAGVRMAREMSPDLIIMDIQMPIMNGYTAIKLLKEDPITKNIKIIAITSFAMPNDRNRILEVGADEYISKPINTRELPILIQKFINQEN